MDGIEIANKEWGGELYTNQLGEVSYDMFSDEEDPVSDDGIDRRHLGGSDPKVLWILVDFEIGFHLGQNPFERFILSRSSPELVFCPCKPLHVTIVYVRYQLANAEEELPRYVLLVYR